MSAIATASCARRPPGKRRLATWHAQPVADVAHRLDRAVAVAGCELAAQVADVDLEHLGARLEVEVPHRVEDLLAREHLIGMAGQVREQLEFTCRQLDLAGIALDATGAQVEADVAGLKHRRLTLC